MNYVDLVKFTRAFKTKSISKVEVYGKIVKRLNRPSNLDDSVQISLDGMFVQMDVFAVNLSCQKSYLKEHNYDSPKFIYMTNGSLVLYIDRTAKVPDWYSISGTLAISKDTTDNIMSLFSWKRDGKQWSLAASVLNDLMLNTFVENDYINIWFNKSIEEDRVVHPDNINNISRFNAEKIIFNQNYKPVSLDAGLQKNINNVDISQYSTKNVLGFKKESRTDIKEYSKKYQLYNDTLNSSLSKNIEFITNLKLEYSLDSTCNDYIQRTISNILKHLTKKPFPRSYTGRGLVKNYLTKYGKQANKNYLGVSIAKYLSDDFQEVADFMRYGGKVNCSGEAWELCKLAFATPEKFYAGIISILTGTSFDILSDIVDICLKYDISFSKLVNENPYALQMIGNLSYNSVEYIAMCVGKANDKSLDYYRNIAILHSYISDTNNGSTIYTIQSIKKNKIGNKLTVARYEDCVNKGTYLSDGTYYNIKNYIGDYDLRYDVSSYVKFGNYNYIKSLSYSEIDTAINDYVKSGLGIVLEDKYLTSCYLLSKELYVYDFFYKMGQRKQNYDHNLIEKYIDQYEREEVGFKLEPEQRKAVHLIDNDCAVIAGSAGSGKTTISNCMVYVLRKLEGDVEIKFSAPTGKASKRMQEVVKQEVKTLNSRFKIFNTQSNLFNSESESDIDDSEFIYMFDEGAMITLDLLYSVVNKMSENSRLYLFGDFHQLSPIGKGLPFRNLLRYLPCQFLTVSKRAADNSAITKNSDIVNNFSDANWMNIESGDDFILVNCSTDKIPDITRDICAYYLNKQVDLLKWGIKSLPKINDIDKDDIQVVSPLTKVSYPWGATRLNNILQPLFNNTKGYDNTFVFQQNSKSYTKFVRGDRVIHTDTNMYSMQWYEAGINNGVLKKKFGFGICNGDVGKIIGFIKTEDVLFEDEDLSTKPADFKYPENIRDDSRYDEEGAYFVIVEYYDYLSSSNYYILYRAKQTKFENNVGLSLNGEDLTKLNLFYAGTVHKLQGSQAKLVISVLGDVNFKGFVTRNMVYTMFTRAEKLEIVIGSVSNDYNSMLSRARRDIASLDTLTVGELL